MLRSSHPENSRSGFTLIEVAVAIVVIVVGLLAMSSTSLVVHSLQDSDELRRSANAGLRAMAENVRSLSNSALGEDDWSQTIVDAYSPGGAIGPTFDVQGLEAWDGEPAVGSVEVITDETRSDADLGVELGMPRDLDNDGLVSNTDVTADGVLLPIIVRVRWTGVAGDREIALSFYVLGY